MRIPGLSPRPCDSRLCACRTVRLNNAASRMVGTITHARHCCRDEIRAEDVETPGRLFFIAPDGEDEPSLWADEGNDYPPQLVRRCDVHPDVWLLLTSHAEVAR